MFLLIFTLDNIYYIIDDLCIFPMIFTCDDIYYQATNLILT